MLCRNCIALSGSFKRFQCKVNQMSRDMIFVRCTCMNAYLCDILENISARLIQKLYFPKLIIINNFIQTVIDSLS